jgi:hypothetical protein
MLFRSMSLFFLVLCIVVLKLLKEVHDSCVVIFIRMLKFYKL